MHLATRDCPVSSSPLQHHVRTLEPYLDEQRVVGAIQIELPQVVPVSKDQERLNVCERREKEKEKGRISGSFGLPGGRRYLT